MIGNYPHVVQPIELMSYHDQGDLKEDIVLYSLGNFTGDEIEPYTDTGILFHQRGNHSINAFFDRLIKYGCCVIVFYADVFYDKSWLDLLSIRSH